MMRLLVEIIKLIFGRVSPEMRKYLVEMVDKLDEKAKSTKNPFDDLGVMLLKALLAIGE